MNQLMCQQIQQYLQVKSKCNFAISLVQHPFQEQHPKVFQNKMLEHRKSLNVKGLMLDFIGLCWFQHSVPSKLYCLTFIKSSIRRDIKPKYLKFFPVLELASVPRGLNVFLGRIGRSFLCALDSPAPPYSRRQRSLSDAWPFSRALGGKSCLMSPQ